MDQRGFVEAFLPTGFWRNARLERIAALIDWAPLEALVRQVRPGETGRPPYRALAMLQALLLQQWYGLSDPGLEEALSDRVSLRAGAGGADASLPPRRRSTPTRRTGSGHGARRRRRAVSRTAPSIAASAASPRCRLHFDFSVIACNLRRAAE
jgi:hypothetical protein